MRIRLIAVGQKMPAWVNEGYQAYARRISDDCQLSLHELPAQKRGKNSAVEQIIAKESAMVRDAVKPGELLVALDVQGRAVNTPQLAQLMADWQMSGRHVTMVIGGPDGFDRQLLQQADVRLSLSRLTLPHPLVRVLLAEQLYRAWSLNRGHPYHR